MVHLKREDRFKPCPMENSKNVFQARKKNKFVNEVVRDGSKQTEEKDDAKKLASERIQIIPIAKETTISCLCQF